MHEPLLDRIRRLERSGQRWQLACLALAIVVVSLLGGTFGTMMLLREPAIERLRMEADAAHKQAEEAMYAERVARQQAEQALQAEKAARQQEGK